MEKGWAINLGGGFHHASAESVSDQKYQPIFEER
jgi:hypothetical protein